MVLLVGALEAGGRLIPEAKDRGSLIHHETRGWTTPANTTFFYANNSVTTNSLGLRSPEPTTAPNVWRILSLGDSSTFGHGVADHETYTAQLAARSGADVQNAGAPGYTCAQSLDRYKELVERLQPHILLVYSLHNDMRVIESSDDFLLSRPSSTSGLVQLVALAQRYMLARQEKPRMSTEEYAACLKDLAKTQRARGGSTIFITPYSDRSFRVQESGTEERGWRRKYLNAIKKVANKSDALHIDLHQLEWTKGASKQDLLLDVVHPTAFGHKLVAEQIHLGIIDYYGLIF